MAALLHDVVEDTSVTEEELREKFGSDVADLVVSVSKPKQLFPDAQDLSVRRDILRELQRYVHI